MRTIILATLIFLSGNLTGSLRADATAPADLDRLIADLDGNEFSQRQSAAQRLSEMGKLAFPALEKAATSDSREASTRAIDMLKKGFHGGDDATKAAAKDALDRLIKSDAPAVARRAAAALLPPKPIEIGMPINGAMPRIGNIQMQVRINGGAGNVRRIHTRITNGVKQVEAEESGRKIKLTDDPAKGIEIDVTETKDGKETTQKYSAKNADELKTKHPDAHKIYEQYGKGNGGLQIQAGLRNIPVQALPNGVPNLVPRAVPAQNSKAQSLQRLDETIKGMDDSIERFRQQNGDTPESKSRIETMETTKRRLLELRSRMAER